ncbi:uncharacterized protein LOC143024159 [Oratosquilla oratoria]|uniref:uncharacterized protein LOC143024159 n=1 Tax=Oratosquilla oratoria TaxID=337810 RepID=UPI003F76AD76
MNKHKPLNADEEVLPGCDDDGDSTVLVAENERRCVKLALLPPSHTQTTLLASPSSPTSLEPLIYDPTAEGNGDVAMGADANHKQGRRDLLVSSLFIVDATDDGPESWL